MSIYLKTSESVASLHSSNTLAKVCTLTYKSANLLVGTLSYIPSVYNGGIAVVSMLRVPGTPYDAVSALTVSEISNGSLSVYAKGAGFVSGHLLQVSVLLSH